MSRSIADRALAIVLGGAAAAAAGLFLLIILFVGREALSSLRDVGLLRFMTDQAWQPTGGANAQYGVATLLAGSLLVTSGAILVAGPIGILSALFAGFYAPRWMGWWLRRGLELVNGIPSVVFGLWGLVVLVPIINRWQPPGQSLLAGSLVLAFMILPTIALLSDAALRSVPAESLQAAAALGLGRWATIWNVVLPAAARGVVASILLAVARAIGETMAVLMVCGNIKQIPASLFDPVRTVTANIALEVGYATSDHRSALFVSALLLLALISGTLLLVDGTARGQGHA